MQIFIVILIITVFKLTFAAAQAPELSHWLPPVHLNLMDYSAQLEKSGLESPSQIRLENKKALQRLSQKNREFDYRKTTLTKKEAWQLLERVINHPIVGHQTIENYDPNHQFGFCFGRATWVWLEALRMGLDKKSIVKIFIVGPMRADDITWQFHVATAVRTKGFFGDSWVVIDTNANRPLSPEEFLAKYESVSTDKKLRLFVSDPQRLGASSTIKFGPMHFKDSRNDSNYNRYFQDMLSHFSNAINYEHTKKCKYLF
ncbi:MAG: hypothetical protein A2622_02690 [Bdellovibrionales bacterium RIFCSPHIGHO2_01_FULL_40_29]|nr:MAG: hypothetical protein A2622_02690 [Bdellovibrionales bacterium RIFCSPHIGHO2_01_FULL_40_29]OFZ33986.1 MAG: hypothetical protein A3D17_03110 [Bdellovibrionales bacterium RIFCSPHIGHO2_02_FULL_40_15]